MNSNFGRSEIIEILANWCDKPLLLEGHRRAILEWSKLPSEFNPHIIGTQMTVRDEGNVAQLAKPFHPSQIMDIVSLIQSPRENHGKYFLCRVIAPVYGVSSRMSTVVDDPDGVCCIRLSYFAEYRLSVGTLFLVENPEIPICRSAPGPLQSKMAIVVNDARKIHVVDDETLEKILPGMTWKTEVPAEYQQRNEPCGEQVAKELPEEFQPEMKDSWKKFGNQFFVKKNYSAAVHCYSNGLFKWPKDEDLLNNRAVANIHLRRFHLALKDAEAVLLLRRLNAKAIYRKTKALCGLKKYEEAQQFLKGMLGDGDTFENLADLTKQMVEVTKLVRQSKSGEYDFVAIIDSKNQYQENVAEFIGPLKIVEVEGKGRGLVATETIKVGRLLMVSKAFAKNDQQSIDVYGNCKRFEKIQKKINTAVKLFYRDPDEYQLIQQVVDKVKAEPESLEELYQLSMGSNFPSSEHFDESHIAALCDHNVFRAGVAQGIWILPSFINHSCCEQNALWQQHGDVLIVRASRDIPAGNEILFCYTPALENYKLRARKCSLLDFNCACHLCEVQQIDPHPQYEGFMYGGWWDKPNVMELEKIFSHVTSLTDDVAKIAHISPLLHLMSEYFQQGNCQKALSLLTTLNEMQMFITPSDSLDIVVGIIKCYNFDCVNMTMKEHGKKLVFWLKQLKKIAINSYGSIDAMKISCPPASDYLLKGLLIELAQFNIDLNDY